MPTTRFASQQKPPRPPPSVPAFDSVTPDATLIHDCLADNGVPDFNPSASFIRSQNRTFNTAYNISTSPANVTHSYSTVAGNAIAADPAKRVDMYSVNYLNFKYGPRGPNDRPIARKTRMQIAKDALAGLVASTNGVRYGLMTFNGLPADLVKRNNEGSQGARVVFPITDMGSTLPGATPQDLLDANNRATLITRIFAQEARGGNAAHRVGIRSHAVFLRPRATLRHQCRNRSQFRRYLAGRAGRRQCRRRCGCHCCMHFGCRRLPHWGDCR